MIDKTHDNEDWSDDFRWAAALTETPVETIENHVKSLQELAEREGLSIAEIAGVPAAYLADEVDPTPIAGRIPMITTWLFCLAGFPSFLLGFIRLFSDGWMMMVTTEKLVVSVLIYALLAGATTGWLLIRGGRITSGLATAAIGLGVFIGGVTVVDQVTEALPWSTTLPTAIWIGAGIALLVVAFRLPDDKPANANTTNDAAWLRRFTGRLFGGHLYSPQEIRRARDTVTAHMAQEPGRAIGEVFGDPVTYADSLGSSLHRTGHRTQLLGIVGAGLFARTVVDARPVRARYSFTTAGAALAPILDTITAWGEQFTPGSDISTDKAADLS